MGYAPDWNKGSMKKSGPTPVKHGVTSRELFHGAKTVQKFADGGEVEYASPALAKSEPVELNIRGEKVGKYEGNDPIAKYRMNMTDADGKSLRYQDNPDMMAEKRPYDSIDAIIDAKATKESKPAVDGGARFLASQAAKATAAITAPKASTPKPKRRAVETFSDDARSPDQVAPPSELPEEAGDMSRNDVRDDLPEEAGSGVPSSKRTRKNTIGISKPKLYYGKK